MILSNHTGFIKGDMVRAMDTNKRDHAKDLIPVGRMGDPIEVAQLVRFLVDARYITGQVRYLINFVNCAAVCDIGLHYRHN